MFRLTLLTLISAALSVAQAPHAFYPWWTPQNSRDLNLTWAQKTKVTGTAESFGPRMLEARKIFQLAEEAFHKEFERDPVDEDKASETIERLAAAQATIVRLQAQMQLKMRSVLTAEQWALVEQGRRVPDKREPQLRAR